MTNNDTLEAARLSPAQAAIVTSAANQIGVAAGPGSGKTHTLTERIKYRILNGMAAPERIAVMTFTNAGAEELRKRLDGIELGYIGTLHGYLFRLIQRHGTLIGYRAGGVNLIGEEDAEDLLLANAKRMGYKGSQKALEERRPTDPRIDLVWKAYTSELRRNNMVDYDTVLRDGLALLKAHQVEAGRWVDLYVDEAQDSAAIDWDIYRCFPADNLFAVGDPDQCHPPGTQIQTGPFQWKNVEDLRDGDVIDGWNRNAQRMLGGRTVKVSGRPYTGDMLTVSCRDKSVDVTPNHKVLIRWADRTSKVCVTYMMHRKGFGYRVGWCQLFQHHASASSHGLHFSVRCRLEGADAGWILGVHNDRTDASVQESIIAAKYGLPLATFNPVNGAKHLTKESIERIFSGVRAENSARAEQCLRDFGRSAEYPLYTYHPKYARSTYMLIHAANLLPGLMKVPTPDGANTWDTVNIVSSRHYTGNVYSLEVEKDEMYAANGIVVHNSIYAFRGARPEMFVNFMAGTQTSRFLLEENYRSGSSICRAATSLISHNRVRVYKIVKPHEGAGKGVITVAQFDDNSAERRQVAMAADSFREGGADVAILCRTNLQVLEFKSALQAMGVPVAEIQRPPMPEGWRHAMAVLQLALDPASGILAERVLRGMGRSAEDIRDLKLQALKEERYLSHYVDYRAYAPDLNELSRLRVDRESIGLIHERWAALPRPSLAALLHDLYTMHREGTLRHTGVVICTIHASKGREWDHVILPGWEEGTVPMLKRDSDDEEERRLSFVAITRARHSVLITHAAERTPPHGHRPEPRNPSRFIKEAAL